MATGNETVVNTQLFQSTADAAQASVKAIDTNIQQLAGAMKTLRAAWQGDSSDDIRNTVESIQGSASELIRILSMYNQTLLEIAGIYVQTEKSNVEAGRSLKFGKIK